MAKLTEQQRKAQKWWRGLSMNEWKVLEKKHKVIHSPAHLYDVEKIYLAETNKGV